MIKPKKKNTYGFKIVKKKNKYCFDFTPTFSKKARCLKQNRPLILVLFLKCGNMKRGEGSSWHVPWRKKNAVERLKLEMSGKGAKGLITAKDKDKKKPISRSSRAGLQVPLSLSLLQSFIILCFSLIKRSQVFTFFNLSCFWSTYVPHLSCISLY